MADVSRQDWVSRVLGVPVGGGSEESGTVAGLFDSGDSGEPPPGLVAYRTSLLEFRTARADVTSQLEGLASRIGETLPEQADLARKVATTIEALCEELSDAIDDGINSMGSERGAQNEKLQGQVLDLLAEVSGNKLIAHVDANPFVPLTVGATLRTALGRVASSIV